MSNHLHFFVCFNVDIGILNWTLSHNPCLNPIREDVLILLWELEIFLKFYLWCVKFTVSVPDSSSELVFFLSASCELVHPVYFNIFNFIVLIGSMLFFRNNIWLNLHLRKLYRLWKVREAYCTHLKLKLGYNGVYLMLLFIAGSWTWGCLCSQQVLYILRSLSTKDYLFIMYKCR